MLFDAALGELTELRHKSLDYARLPFDDLLFLLLSHNLRVIVLALSDTELCARRVGRELQRIKVVLFQIISVRIIVQYLRTAMLLEILWRELRCRLTLHLQIYFLNIFAGKSYTNLKNSK